MLVNPIHRVSVGLPVLLSAGRVTILFAAVWCGSVHLSWFYIVSVGTCVHNSAQLRTIYQRSVKMFLNITIYLWNISSSKRNNTLAFLFTLYTLCFEHSMSNNSSHYAGVVILAEIVGYNAAHRRSPTSLHHTTQHVFIFIVWETTPIPPMQNEQSLCQPFTRCTALWKVWLSWGINSLCVMEHICFPANSWFTKWNWSAHRTDYTKP